MSIDSHDTLHLQVFHSVRTTLPRDDGAESVRCERTAHITERTAELTDMVPPPSPQMLQALSRLGAQAIIGRDGQIAGVRAWHNGSRANADYFLETAGREHNKEVAVALGLAATTDQLDAATQEEVHRRVWHHIWHAPDGSLQDPPYVYAF